MQNPLRATDPDQQASVQASAGTGKTWMLITRILKLLLHGVEPGRILALTFTRKAAAEMLTRLSERAREWSAANDEALQRNLKEVGLKATPELMQQARALYEKLLHCQYPVRISTFHSFAQELLMRFPLEAEIPPAFELLVDSYELEQEAWARVNDQANRIAASSRPSQEETLLLDDLQYLFQQCGSVDNTKSLLNQFINTRIDWWAFTQQQNSQIDYACDSLRTLLLLKQQKIIDINQFLQTVLSKAYLLQLEKLKEFLKRHSKRNELKQIENIDLALDTRRDWQDRFNACCTALFKKDGAPFKVSGALAKSIGEHDMDEFYQSYEFLVQETEKSKDLLERLQIYRLSSAWFRIGNLYLTLFQTIKRERRVLDFSDLEWKTYQLLNHSDNAHWIQYKLDQRIDHLLVDEFQDTNPTQWNLLLPFLREMASAQAENLRSIFIVGDTKQSIYQFRRANPKLLNEASEWLNNNLGAQTYQLSSSRRSSPVVIDVVNKVFLEKASYPGFQEHSTYQESLWGQAGVLPLCEETAGKQEIESFRNPLLKPRASREKERYLKEAESVVNKIQSLVNGDYRVKDGDRVRPIQYADIMILVRKRTNAHYFEKILTERRIPFIGTDRGNFLNCLEVQDLIALLTILVNPHDNLLMAQVLRSPLFNLHEQELFEIANSADGSWYQYFQYSFEPKSDPENQKIENDKEKDKDKNKEQKPEQQQAPKKICENERCRASYQTLKQWRYLTGKLPLHDLLDQLYYETNIIARYEKVFPPALKPRLRANFAKFIDLALDLDSGRYPSVSRFLEHIRTLKLNPQNAPDTPPSNDQSDRLQILTVHSSKGLEAPVLFMVDTCEQKEPNNRFYTCVNWPSTSSKPIHFFITHTSLKQNPALQPIINPQADSMKLENNNLLYVALTRAKQYLYVSGSLGTRQKELGWYGQILEAVKQLGEEVDGEWQYTYLTQPALTPTKTTDETDTETVPADFNVWLTQLQQDINHATQEEFTESDLESLENETENTLASGQSGQDTAKKQPDKKKAKRQTAKSIKRSSLIGQIIHRILELKLQDPTLTNKQLNTRIQADTKLQCSNAEIETAWHNVNTTLNDKKLARFFNPDKYDTAYNEIPISYFNQNNWANGIIDRLVISNELIYLIDYKSHQFQPEEQPEKVAQLYREQLKAYALGVKKLWPQHKIIPVILFTEIGVACELRGQV